MKPTAASYLLIFICIISLSHFSASAQLAIENKFPKAAPLKVEFKNDASPDWAHELEIIVTNTGKKPIYYLYILLYLDVKDETGITRGFTFDFGNGKTLYSTEGVAAEGDPSLLPNESYTFKIDDNTAKAWDLSKRRTTFVEPRSAELSLGWLNFGDGTGLQGGGKPFPFRKQ